jgi:hypothetical protein
VFLFLNFSTVKYLTIFCNMFITLRSNGNMCFIVLYRAKDFHGLQIHFKYLVHVKV